MKILSLFDGISCGRLALERAGIPVEKYYASEIDKYAIQVAQKNYPDTIQVGDVTKLNYLELLDVDMVIGGSPCQDLSIAKQNREGLRGARSGLFWKYVEALEVIRPKWFLLENVASMRNEDRDAITATLKKIYPETECVMINSALVSAQQRKRYYWTNWHVEQPEDKGIVLKDILENVCGTPTTLTERYGTKGLCYEDGKGKSLSATCHKGYGNDGTTLVAVNIDNYFRKYGTKGKIMSKDTEKTQCLTASMGCGGGNNPLLAEPIVPFVVSKLKDIETKFGEIPPMFNPYNKQKITDKAPTQTAQCGSQTKSSTVMIFEPIKPNRIGGFYNQVTRWGIYDENGTSPTLTASMGMGGGFVPMIPERVGTKEGLGKGQANRIYSVRGKSVCLNANGGGSGAKTGLYKVDLPDGDYIIRKLTPVECERLQTLPDGWTAGVSNTQRYKAIGNGWTVDVIAWIFGQLPQE